MISSEIAKVREEASQYENSLDDVTRKYNGRYFTGLPLSRLLASLALKHDCSTVIDPMAGHGDLLDATLEIATERSIKLQRIHGIEINRKTAAICKNRLDSWRNAKAINDYHIFVNDAFNPSLTKKLDSFGYDLVITNPPFVRYQNISAKNNNYTTQHIRKELLAIAASMIHKDELPIWGKLIDHYSGHSDLSIPASLLAAMMVRPGGILALVAPLAWESRDYANIIKYLLTRLFKLETVVKDKPPGWFPNALVRTQLIVAKRLQTSDALRPTREKYATDKYYTQVEISPNCKTEDSMVGVCFSAPHSEHKFNNWLNQDYDKNNTDIRELIIVKQINIKTESKQLLERIAQKKWVQGLEESKETIVIKKDIPGIIPEILRNTLPQIGAYNLNTVDTSNIQVGQGLRTGCNDFFYVTRIENLDNDSVKIRLSNLFKNEELVVPIQAVCGVIRNQSDLKPPNSVDNAIGLLLNLNNYVLPEDYQTVTAAKESYIRAKKDIPSIMSVDLSRHVRQAQNTNYAKSNTNKMIPELSAVRTNVRRFNVKTPNFYPRFWYMLPNFADRHLPQAFVPRINHSSPWTIANSNPPIIIDANFSTIWQTGNEWTPQAIAALMNSAWCRAYMESIGTPFGGGALKLEAIHLRQIQVPILSGEERNYLDELGGELSSTVNATTTHTLSRIDHLIISSIIGDSDISVIDKVSSNLYSLLFELCKNRQR